MQGLATHVAKRNGMASNGFYGAVLASAKSQHNGWQCLCDRQKKRAAKAARLFRLFRLSKGLLASAPVLASSDCFPLQSVGHA
jgi:hypothetical protein